MFLNIKITTIEKATICFELIRGTYNETIWHNESCLKALETAAKTDYF